MCGYQCLTQRNTGTGNKAKTENIDHCQIANPQTPQGACIQNESFHLASFLLTGKTRFKGSRPPSRGGKSAAARSLALFRRRKLCVSCFCLTAESKGSNHGSHAQVGADCAVAAALTARLHSCSPPLYAPSGPTLKRHCTCSRLQQG